MASRRNALALVSLLASACADPSARANRDAGPASTVDAPGVDARAIEGADAYVATDLDAYTSDDAWASPGEPDAFTPFGPPLATPPSGPPDHASVIHALAAERPDLFSGSCLAMGGSRDFLFEAVRRLRAIDLRYGLVVRGGALLEDRVAYYWGAGGAEGSSEIYALDVIVRHCARAGIDEPAAPGWGDDTGAGGTWTILPLTGALPDHDAGPPIDAALDAPMPPAPLPLPDMRSVVDALAAERPDLLAASCVDMGGNNDFLFELVRRLRRIDTRWGLNWKRARIGDMSQDVVDYYWGTPGPIEDGFDTYVVDVIGGHCGPDPRPAFTDVTDFGSTGARWTLAGRSDLGP